jgi:hypothetical protein
MGKPNNFLAAIVIAGVAALLGYFWTARSAGADRWPVHTASPPSQPLLSHVRPTSDLIDTFEAELLAQGHGLGLCCAEWENMLGKNSQFAISPRYWVLSPSRKPFHMVPSWIAEDWVHFAVVHAHLTKQLGGLVVDAGGNLVCDNICSCSNFADDNLPLQGTYSWYAGRLGFDVQYFEIQSELVAAARVSRAANKLEDRVVLNNFGLSAG